MTTAASGPVTGTPAAPLRVAFVLPGLHRVTRGAEVAFEEVARHMAANSNCDVTLIGSGPPREHAPYRFLHADARSRQAFEGWPKLPCLRSHYAWEELTFVPGLLRRFNPEEYDVTVTCAYPWTNWALRWRRGRLGPRHVFVTQNGDWMVQARAREYRWFGCDGLICTNPEYYERHRQRWSSALIPNGVDVQRFVPGRGARAEFGLPDGAQVVLMVSALIPSKRVLEGIEAVSHLKDVWLLVAGDGELRDAVMKAGQDRLGSRFRLLQLASARMPELYRCADVCLHMSLDEPFGNVYVEALATGIPVVAHDRSVTRWALGDCGCFVDTLQLHCVAKGIQMAMERRSPAESRLRRSFAERRYSWARIAEQYEQFLRSVVMNRA